MKDHETIVAELLDLTRRLLDSITEADWETYQRLCDPTITSFEPESRGHLIEGMDFHGFYFDRGAAEGPHNTTISTPKVRLLGDDVAIVCYVRMTQQLDASGSPVTQCFDETRLWHRDEEGAWRHVHFHRSATP